MSALMSVAVLRDARRHGLGLLRQRLAAHAESVNCQASDLTLHSGLFRSFPL